MRIIEMENKLIRPKRDGFRMVAKDDNVVRDGRAGLRSDPVQTCPFRGLT
jgi:hypothetical protein